ncbi:TetR/AcrR family transcriptional regulator [Microbacterium sp. 18062]|uniref:TetR/AcrR family transcriptional regulator n=1 Tax=Microbacterium sp. 18062 TaxID=2681410 RepID=UPI001358448C|nr:TetR/AcrR family transcriptional regulator [Microbacterium sp. 18062]
MPENAARPSKRGPYARGRKNRQLILDAAMEVIGDKGYNSTLLQDIAAEVGITPAGILHHFESKEALLAEVLRERDTVNRQRFAGGDEQYPMTVHVMRHNAGVPGLIQLYVSTVAAASDPHHPLREYLLERDAEILESVKADIVRRQEAGTVNPGVDAEKFARVLVSLSDGLQAQWTIDSTIDLPGVLEWLWETLAAPPR